MDGGRPKILVVSGPNIGQEHIARLLGGWFDVHAASAGAGESSIEQITGAAEAGYHAGIFDTGIASGALPATRASRSPPSACAKAWTPMS